MKMVSIRYYMDGETLDNVKGSGRDQTHTQLGLGMMSMLFVRRSGNKVPDLYGVLDNRLPKAMNIKLNII